MMNSYEIQFFRGHANLSASCFSLFASDRHALCGARRLLDERLSSATVWQGDRCVGKVCRVELVSPIAA